MSIDPKIYVGVGILSTAVAQVLLKKSGEFGFLQARWSAFLLASVASYFISFASYYMALKFFEISKVQPIMMASILALIAVYGLFIGENFTRYRVSGLLLAIVSVVLISRS